MQGVTNAGAGEETVIGNFIPQDGSSTTALTSSSAVPGNYLLDVDANTKALIIIQRVSAAGGVEVLDTLTTKRLKTQNQLVLHQMVNTGLITHLLD